MNLKRVHKNNKREKQQRQSGRNSKGKSCVGGKRLQRLKWDGSPKRDEWEEPIPHHRHLVSSRNS